MNDLDRIVNRLPARVTGIVLASPDQLDQLRALPVFDETVLADSQPYVWPMEISNDRLDAYWTRMDPETTLPNYARDATEGVAFLAGHNTRALPFGYTYDGQVELDGGQVRVVAHGYTFPGLELGGVRTSDFIAGIQRKLIRDVSIGFTGGEWICSICGRDMLTDWDCWHWPGVMYEENQPGEPGTAGTTVEVRCTALIRDAHLSEVSAVFDGATPNAMILRAVRAIGEGRVTRVQRFSLERLYRTALPEIPMGFPGATLVAEPLATVIRSEDQPSTELAVAVTHDLPVSDADRQAIEDGRRWKRTLIDQALVEGVRLFGPEWDQDVYRPLFESLTTEQIETIIMDWERAATAKLAGARAKPGRVSQDVAPSTTPAPPPRPTDVYRT